MVPHCPPCQGNMESATMAIEILDATYGDANNTLTSGQKSSSFQLLASYLVNASAATRPKNHCSPLRDAYHYVFPHFWRTCVRF